MIKFCSKLILIFLTMSFLASCAAVPVLVIGGGTAVGGYYLGKDERSAKRIAKDVSITAEINKEYLADDMIKTFKINVDTHRGAVTLSGKLSSQQTIDRAVEIAQSVEGVIEVNSLLTVEEAAQQKSE